jgi:hypothetical protein
VGVRPPPGTNKISGFTKSTHLRMRFSVPKVLKTCVLWNRAFVIALGMSTLPIDVRLIAHAIIVLPSAAIHDERPLRSLASRSCASGKGITMNRVLASLLFVFSAAPVAMGQCAIQAIKPIPPIGCKDVTPQCVSGGNGQSYWNWVCVPTNAGNDTSNDRAWAVKSVLENSDGNARLSTIERAGASPRVKQDNEQTQGQGSTINKAPLEISAVGIGMAREIVLSGLAGRYKLTKEDLGGGAGSQLEVWLVEEKASSTSADFWEIAFTDGKVGSVITRLSPTLHGDAVGLAQQLFAELYPRADVDSGQVAKFLGTRRITVDVELGQMSSGKSNEETMRFQFPNGRIFEIKIAAPLTSAPSVNTSDFRSQ